MKEYIIKFKHGTVYRGTSMNYFYITVKAENRAAVNAIMDIEFPNVTFSVVEDTTQIKLTKEFKNNFTTIIQNQ